MSILISKKFINQQFTTRKHKVKNAIFLHVLGVLSYGCIRLSYSGKRLIDRIEMFYSLFKYLNKFFTHWKAFYFCYLRCV